ncbi:hypothetical protein [Allofournierella sp.]|uniref:hypothetical protein n=1 Tax=Allofournierella sp. TaxID=1940256 RepID=UPI003AB2355E
MNQKMWIALAVGCIVLLAILLTVLRALWIAKKDREKRPFDKPDFTNYAGFKVTNLPGDEIVRLESVYLIGRKVAQLEFVIDPEWKAILRIARKGVPLRLEEFQQNYEQRTVTYEDGVRVVVQQNPGGEALMTWTKDEFDYALYFERTQMGLVGGMLDDFVRETETVES